MKTSLVETKTFIGHIKHYFKDMPDEFYWVPAKDVPDKHTFVLELKTRVSNLDQDEIRVAEFYFGYSPSEDVYVWSANINIPDIPWCGYGPRTFVKGKTIRISYPNCRSRTVKGVIQLTSLKDEAPRWVKTLDSVDFKKLFESFKEYKEEHIYVDQCLRQMLPQRD